MTNTLFDPNRRVDWNTARQAYINDGYLPTKTWVVVETYGDGKILLKTQDPEDIKRHHYYNRPGVTIVRQYLKETETWVKEDPFPEIEDDKPAITSSYIIDFVVTGLGVDLEPWQEDLIHARFKDRDEAGTS